MSSTVPSTPGRGRSRFSKVLPKPPEDTTSSMEKSTASGPSSLESALPPLPQGKSTAMSIPRRPVGAQVKHSKSPSIASVSSIYSDSPGLSRSLSNGSSYNTKYSLSLDSESGPTPPLPPKDIQRSQTMPSSPTILASPISSLRSSPSRPEIWKRRSVRSEKSLSFPDLKLDRSNGSTASPPRRQEQAARAHIPRSIAGGRKPVPARPAPPQPDLMGNKIAKLRGRQPSIQPTPLDLGDSSKKASNDEAPNQYTSFQRLPTPEYLRTDKQQPLAPQVLSSISPVTPSEEQSPELPSRSETRPTVAVPPALSDSTNRPNLLSTHSREPSEILTIASEPAFMRSPQPKQAFAAKILSPQPSPDRDSPLPLPSPLPPPAGLGINFPTFPSQAEKGTVMPGRPLDIIHFHCYHSHKFMRSSRNALCPIGCMICQEKDAEMRWKCTWCCLSACGSCMQVLSSIPGKDLRVCLERIGK